MTLHEHARRELELIGEEPATIDWYLRVVDAFASYGHSGGSAEVTTAVLHDLLRYKPLSDLTNDPAEWIDRTEMSAHPLWWQNVRNPEAFSTDGGKTYYLLSEQVGDGVTPIHQTKATQHAE